DAVFIFTVGLVAASAGSAIAGTAESPSSNITTAKNWRIGEENVADIIAVLLSIKNVISAALSAELLQPMPCAKKARSANHVFFCQCFIEGFARFCGLHFVDSQPE